MYTVFVKYCAYISHSCLYIYTLHCVYPLYLFTIPLYTTHVYTIRNILLLYTLLLYILVYVILSFTYTLYSYIIYRYGGMLEVFIEEMVQRTRLGRGHSFLDIGSGIGQVCARVVYMRGWYMYTTYILRSICEHSIYEYI